MSTIGERAEVDEHGDLRRTHSLRDGVADDDVLERSRQQVVGAEPGAAFEFGERWRLVIECPSEAVGGFGGESRVQRVIPVSSSISMDMVASACQRSARSSPSSSSSVISSTIVCSLRRSDSGDSDVASSVIS